MKTQHEKINLASYFLSNDLVSVSAMCRAFQGFDGGIENVTCPEYEMAFVYLQRCFTDNCPKNIENYITHFDVAKAIQLQATLCNDPIHIVYLEQVLKTIKIDKMELFSRTQITFAYKEAFSILDTIKSGSKKYYYTLPNSIKLWHNTHGLQY
jgi:hypothetical protein